MLEKSRVLSLFKLWGMVIGAERIKKMKSKKSIGKFLIGICLMLCSYAFLQLMPNEESAGAYFIFAVSAFCFIVGIVWVGNFFSNPSSKFAAALFNVCFTLVSIIMIVYGIYYMITDDFSFRGTLIFTILLIEAIFIFMLAKGSVYNEAVDGIQIVTELHTPINELFEAFKDVDTPYGRPWMGHVKSIEEECMIYGPTKDDSFLFAYYSFGKFFIGENGYYASLNEEDAEEHLVDITIGNGHENDEDAPLFNLIGRLYPAMYRSMFTAYAQTGIAEWKYGSLSNGNGAKVYTFDEHFAWFHQIYHLINQDGNQIYEIKGMVPFKTFRLIDSARGEEVLRMTKRLFHLFPRYDFYIDGKFYGFMRQRAKIWHDEFKMNTADGCLKLRKINATISTNYAVYMDDCLIGTLSENLSLHIRNLVFDNFTITVFDDKYLPLLTAMGIMAERELVRDREGEI